MRIKPVIISDGMTTKQITDALVDQFESIAPGMGAHVRPGIEFGAKHMDDIEILDEECHAGIMSDSFSEINADLCAHIIHESITPAHFDEAERNLQEKLDGIKNARRRIGL